jgi:dihydroxy-acid dehydratase
VPTVHSATLGEALDAGTSRRTNEEGACALLPAAPGGVPTQVAFSQDTRWDDLDLDRENGCIRDVEHAYSKDGGLAVLYGNIAEDGCIVKTAGVDESILEVHRARRASSRARTPRWRPSSATRSSPATWW